MLSTDKKNCYRSFDEVISDIDDFMCRDLEDKATKSATTLIEERKEPEPPSVEPVKPSVLRIVTILFLLLPFILTALVYLIYTGDIYSFIAALTDIWNGFAKWLKAFLS